MKLKVKILAVFLVTGLTVLAQSRTVTGEIPDSGKSLKTNSVEEVVKAMTLEEKVFMVIGNKNNYWSEHGFLGVGATYRVTAWVFRRQFWMTGRFADTSSNGKATNVLIIVRHFLRQRLWRLRGIRKLNEQVGANDGK